MKKKSFHCFGLLTVLASMAPACSSNEATEPASSSAGADGLSGGAGGGGNSASAGLAQGGGAGSLGFSGAAGSAPSGTGGSAGGGAGLPNGTAGSAGSGGAAGDGAGGSSVAGAGSGGSGGSAGAANGSCPPNAQLCLDFEDGAFSGWTKKESGGTISVDGTHVSHGTKSLLISVPAGKAGGMIENRGAPLFPLPKKQLWGRMMVYFEGVPDGHTDLARGNSGNGGPNYNVGEQHASIMLNYYAGSAATDCWARPKPEKKVPDKTWMCWEWRFDSEKNQMDFWMDGTLLRSVDKNGDGCLSGNGVWQAPADFGSISVGQQIAQVSNNTAYKTWIDDVAISNSARVGCPQ